MTLHTMERVTNKNRPNEDVSAYFKKGADVLKNEDQLK